MHGLIDSACVLQGKVEYGYLKCLNIDLKNMNIKNIWTVKHILKALMQI